MFLTTKPVPITIMSFHIHISNVFQVFLFFFFNSCFLETGPHVVNPASQKKEHYHNSKQALIKYWPA